MPYDLIAKGGTVTGLVVLIAFLVYWLTKELSKINNRVLDESATREKAAVDREIKSNERERLLLEHLEVLNKSQTDQTVMMERITKELGEVNKDVTELKIICERRKI